MNYRQLTILLSSALLLSSCADPYSPLNGGSPSQLEEDLRFVEKYHETICGIQEQHENEQISRGKCLALYYDYKEKMHIKDERREVIQRVRYILASPGKFDQDSYDLVSTATSEIVDCKNYIEKNCI